MAYSFQKFEYPLCTALTATRLKKGRASEDKLQLKLYILHEICMGFLFFRAIVEKGVFIPKMLFC